MDYYYKEFEKLQKEFHEVMHDYPLFEEDILEIEEKRIKEINELLDKKDEYYFKQAISKLEDLILYVKQTSLSVKNEYDKFDRLATNWEKIHIINVSEKELKEVNSKVKKANELIKSHVLSDLKEANKIMENLIRELSK